jgi:hypothetical protein
MSRRPALSIRLIHAWVRLYTAGLPTRLRDDRRAEIRSDLAEHADCRTAEGLGPGAIVRERTMRTILGAPADLRWRREAVVALRPPGPAGPLRSTCAWTRGEWPTLAGLALASFYLIFALYVFGLDLLDGAPVLRRFSVDALSGRTIGAGIMLLLGLALIGASLARLLVSTTADVAMAVLALPAVPFFWMVVPTLLAIIVMAGVGADLAREDMAAAVENNG